MATWCIGTRGRENSISLRALTAVGTLLVRTLSWFVVRVEPNNKALHMAEVYEDPFHNQ